MKFKRVLLVILSICMLLGGCTRSEEKIQKEIEAQGKEYNENTAYEYETGVTMEEDILNAVEHVIGNVNESMEIVADYKTFNDSFYTNFESQYDFIKGTLVDVEELNNEIQTYDNIRDSIKERLNSLVVNINDNVLPFYESLQDYARTENEKYAEVASEYYYKSLINNTEIMDKVERSRAQISE